MNLRSVSWLLQFYPSGWRSEYGAEMEDLLGREPLTFARMCDVLRGAFREQVRQPQARFLISSVLSSVGLFLLAVSCSPLLWRLVAAPVVQVLRDQKVHGAMLIANSPWEAPVVIWLGIPLLLTLFAAYPVSMVFACRGAIISRALKATAARSATLYAVGFAVGLLAWQLGSFAWLMRFIQQSQNMQAVSMSGCFGLLAASTLGTAVAVQVPLLLLHSSCSKPKPFQAK